MWGYSDEGKVIVVHSRGGEVVVCEEEMVPGRLFIRLAFASVEHRNGSLSPPDLMTPNDSTISPHYTATELSVQFILVDPGFLNLPEPTRAESETLYAGIQCSAVDNDGAAF